MYLRKNGVLYPEYKGGMKMGRTITRRKKRPVRRRRRLKKAKRESSEVEMDETFYMYSTDDLPEIESDLFDTDVKPEINRDFYL